MKKNKKMYNEGELNCIDREINKLEEYKRKLYFENIDNKKKNSTVVIPLVADGESDYEIIKDEKKRLKEEIRKIEKILDNIEIYVSSTFSKAKESKSIENYKSNLINLLKEKMTNLKEKLQQLENNPEYYLNLKKCDNGNYHIIEDSSVVYKLNNIDDQLKNLYRRRNRLLKMDASRTLSPTNDKVYAFKNESTMKEEKKS